MKKDKRLIGRGSEVLMNKKLYKIIKQLETLSLNDDHKLIHKPEEEKGLWIDPSSENDLKYYENGQWHLFYKNKFKITTEILKPYMPKDPVPGQLWINDGILMYFDGTEWMVIKAGNIDKEEFNISNYHDFVLIDPLIEQGNLIVDSTAGRPIEKSQFLIPNEYTTKFFIDGFINKDYDRVTNVAIQYETARMKNKIAAAAHINPSNLIDIDKKLILIGKNPKDSLVRINTHNCEIYGMTHGRGRLLLQEIDYIKTSGNYIKLRERTQKKFDFLLIIRYIFGKTTHKGELLSQDIDIKNETSSSLILKGEPLEYRYFIAQDGIIKSVDRNTYTINGNKITLNDIKKDKTTQLLSFHFDNLLDRGTIKDGIINIKKPNQKVLGIIEYNNGYRLQSLNIVDNKIKIDNHIKNAYYILFKEERNENKKSLQYKKHGIVKDGTIKANIVGREKILLTINNKIINKDEYNINYTDQIITVDNKYDFLEYTIYNDDNGTVLLDEKIKDIIIPLNNNEDLTYNKTIAYLDEHIICDESTVLSYNLPTKGEPNELRKILNTSGKPKWYIYNNNEWKELVSPRDKTVKILNNEDKINKPRVLEVFNSKDNQEVRMETEKSILKYLKTTKEQIHDLRIEIYKNKVISTVLYNGISHSFNFLLKEVDIKIPDYIYSFELELMKKLNKAGRDQDSLKYLANKTIDSLKREIQRINNVKPLRIIADIIIDKSEIRTKVVQDRGSLNYDDYKEGIGLLEHLEFTISSYSDSNDSINLFNHFNGSKLRTYSYRFASQIEKPRKIKEKTIDLKDNNKGFMIDYHNFFIPKSNDLSIYLDGVKQYDILEVEDNAFKFKGEYVDGNPRYAKVLAVSEPPERENSISCQREIIELSNSMPGMFNTYKTKIDLYPGYNRVFIDGIRQSQKAYEILDANTIILKNIAKESINNSKMMIEHKGDLSINEKTIEINEPLKAGRIDINKYDIDPSILESGEEILIYIDGVFLGNQYEIDRETESIIITSKVSQYIGRNMIYYESILEHKSKIDEYMNILESEDIPWEQKEKTLEEINQLEELIKSLDIRSTTTVIFEWR